MRVDDGYQLGYISKTHGLQGEVNIYLDVDFPENYQNLESVFVAFKESPQTLIPFFIEAFSLSGNRAIVKFEDVDSLEAAERFKEAQLYLPLALLPKLPKGQFYFHDIIGFTVIDQNLGTLGAVTDVYALPAQDMIAMQYQAKEILIPMSDDIVLSADMEKQELQVNLPEGLLDVYLD